VPPFAESDLHMVSGLLLPIWKRLPTDSPRVYRLQTDEGERVIGRKVSALWAATAEATTSGQALNLAPDEAFSRLCQGLCVIDLAEGLQLRRVRVMHEYRLELCGFSDQMRERLKAYGLFTEIIAWKLRMFVPMGENGPEVIDKLLKAYPLIAINDKPSDGAAA